MNDFGFYLVMTDPLVGYEECCRAAVRAGVKMVQLRMKEVPRGEVVAVGRALRRITAGTETAFIVNDDPSVAAEVGADGVHVGQSDMPVAEVRRRFPSLRIVGLSTHNHGQALAAAAVKPDYIGVGPVYATPTKKIPDPTLGPETAGEMIRSVGFPAVAIGGINIETLPAVLAAGARNFAVVRPVCRASDPYAAIRELQNAAAGALNKEELT
ncbi:MAG: thiamine phosphate synthase [Kiritimatiellae bacterium]|nr:thiamine phosphate synthase [Kiritimatiellia bacterium]